MAITRRQFLKCSGSAAAGAFLAPRLFGSSFVQDALAAIGNRYFVVLFLDGGNDGLEHGRPDGRHVRVRGTSRRARPVPAASASTAPASTTPRSRTTPTPAHRSRCIPASAPRRSVPAAPATAASGRSTTQGHVAVVQGCGYPRYTPVARGLAADLPDRPTRASRSTRARAGSDAICVGRVRRAIDGDPGRQHRRLASRPTSDRARRACSRSGVSRDFSFPYDSDYNSNSEKSARDTAFNALHLQAQSGVDPGFKYIGNAGSTTLASTSAYPALHSLYTNNPTRNAFGKLYDNGTPAGVNRSTSRDLLEVAKVIWGTEQGMVNSRFFWVENGGYDTHSDQGADETDGQHFSLHSEIGASLKVFYDDLASMGVADRVCIMVYSEFSRRITQNDNGTDHGSQGPMFLIGGKVARRRLRQPPAHRPGAARRRGQHPLPPERQQQRLRVDRLPRRLRHHSQQVDGREPALGPDRRLRRPDPQLDASPTSTCRSSCLRRESERRGASPHARDAPRPARRRRRLPPGGPVVRPHVRRPGPPLGRAPTATPVSPRSPTTIAGSRSRPFPPIAWSRP
mgnify:CR=1 FL=1